MTRDEDEKVCRDIYRETQIFYNELKPHLGDGAQGFQILYGPPVFEPEIFFIGYQPGRGCKTPDEERAYGSECRWPPKSEYVTECWPLARRLREMFPSFLEQCVGLNAIFVRADDIQSYKKNVTPEYRRKIAGFCLPRVIRIINAIQPKRIVTIGFDTLTLFMDGKRGVPGMRRDRGSNPLTRVGQIAGREAVAVLHLTGAWPSRDERRRITDLLRPVKN